jgi:hypothetical protein
LLSRGMIFTVAERADHRSEIRAPLVLRPVGFVDAVVDRPSTGSKVTSFVMPAETIRPVFCLTAA